MRVIAGHWKGRRLKAGRGNMLRPTTDRVKEALFSLLGARVTDSEVVDLCCGAGSLGIEALSRGARRVRFVDSSPVALSLVRANLAACRASPETYVLTRAEVLSWLGRFLAGDPQHLTIVLADPPYATGLAQAIIVALLQAPVAFPLGVAVVEHPSAVDWQVPESDRLQYRQRRFGATTLTILER